MTEPATIKGLETQAQADRGPPPVHLWNPAHCGAIDIVIRADGVWMHEGSPIGREAMVRLFAGVLRREDDEYWLVTPVEKMKIRVEDLPFRAVAVTRDGDDLVFVTDRGDAVRAGPDNPLVVDTDEATGEPRPRVHVRRDLWARIGRPVFYELAEMATLEEGRLIVRSGGRTFVLGAAQ